MPTHSAALANEFIDRANSCGKQLTQMQLQKLVYIAHGWNLAINGSPLTEDTPQAWDYGPVYRDLWLALRSFGKSAVNEKIKIGQVGAGIFSPNADDEIRANLLPAEKRIVDKVFDLYSDFHAYQLSAMTHKQGTPWYQIYEVEGKKKGNIDAERIKQHFVSLAQQRHTANA
ncbi:Panacea domain-containing protein [uncultured Thalassospira sp.]|jgi:uncharacterized phage-associated protein|uniref:Panacea domain-containing protein n=1 Tax=uncultured Thalassospira sp. TaxID=404382 RepID=UPI0030DC1E54|tara:strand:+ start:366 stop:881 length:516 start_codon:yes stop_codon:yes gene_type:complete